ncbi:MAG TPA: polysaccharide deacetylase family protein [Kiloniellales bacterium]|nr:polysaccharide deacetylase family protein [Kiloniellales bacterium]
MPVPRPASLVALYHAVGTARTTGYRDALDREALARQLDWLAARYAVLPLGELLRLRREGAPLAGLAAITFDDNHRSVLELALPLLAERGLPATWCLIGGVLAGRPYWRRQVQSLIDRDEVGAFLAFAREQDPAAISGIRPERFYRDSKDPGRCRVPALMALLDRFRPGGADPALVRAEDLAGLAPLPGVTLANHSLTHPVFAGLSQAQQREEVMLGRTAVAAVGWATVDVLALPFGGADSYDASLPAALASAGCEAVLLTGSEGTAADDLSAHPALAGGPPTALVRVLLGSLTLD